MIIRTAALSAVAAIALGASSVPAPSSASVPGRHRDALRPATFSAPVVDASGAPSLLSTRPLASPAAVSLVPGPATGAIAIPAGTSFASFRRAPDGSLRAAWVESRADGPDLIRWARMDRDAPVVEASAACAGTVTAFDFLVDRAGVSLTVWAERTSAGATVLRVRSSALGVGILDVLPEASVTGLSIAAGPAGDAWLAWSVADSAGMRIRARRWFGGSLGPATDASSGAAGPCVRPSVAVDGLGRSWILWSGFDGRDYEIYRSSWTGSSWAAPEALTDDAGSDTDPTCVVMPDGAVWAVFGRTGGGASGIFMVPADGPAPRDAVVPLVEAPGAAIRGVRASARDGRIAAAWEQDGGVRASAWSFRDLPAPRPARRILGSVPEARLDDDAFVGFGDSITYGMIDGKETPELGYLPRLEALLQGVYGSSAKTVNKGRPGEITINALGRLDDVLAETRARYILIMEGTNDVVFIEVPMEETAFNLEQMILKCRRAGVYPILSTIIPRDDWRWGTKFYRDRVFALNALIRRLAENLNVPLVDMFAAFYQHSDAGGDYTTLLSDGVHPNEEGYALMAASWFAEVRRSPFPPSALTLRRVTQRALLAGRPLNILSWQLNPKLGDLTAFVRVLVERRDLSAEEGTFATAASLPITIFQVPQSYTDLEASASGRYLYRVRIVRLDRVEGPPSDTVGD